MSAGGLSYSGLRTTAKVTLPSVDMWGTDMNILKDPPKSIHTRRIDKVGQTQSILLAQDESGDRICEMINVYARGVNPMVSVSYDNYSNNGGKGPLANTTAVSLPYKVENVRPPVYRQEDLLPLSRLPRNWFYSYSNPSFPDLVQAEQCNDGDRAIHQTILHPSAATNKGVDLVHDQTQPRDAAGNAVSDEKIQVEAQAKKALPVRVSLREERDTGGEKKSILVDKRDATARTNIKGTISIQAEKGFDLLDKGRVHDAIANIQVQSKKYGGTASVQGENDFLVKDPKQFHMNRLAYQAFTNQGRDISTGNRHANEVIDMNKFINKDKYLCIARTSRVKENFVHPVLDASTVPTKEYLYTEARTTPTSIFQLSATSPEKDIQLADPLRASARTALSAIGDGGSRMDAEKHLDDPLRVSGKTTLSAPATRITLQHETMGRDYKPNPSQAFDVSTGKTLSVQRPMEADHLDKSRVHDSVIHCSVEASKQITGGTTPISDSISSFVPSRRVNVSADTVKTLSGEGDNPLVDGKMRDLQRKTTGDAVVNKSMIGDHRRLGDTSMTRMIQEVLPTSAETRKTFIGTTSDPFQDSTVALHNDKRTPIHSVATNSASPFSKDLPHEFQREQVRRVLHAETSTFGTDIKQLEATGDVYSIQNRRGRVQEGLQKGGFENQGSAIPVFNRYEDYRKVMAESQRDALRKKTSDMFHDRYPPATIK